MIKNKFLFKNWFYFAIFLISTLFFVALRCLYLCFLTNLETGICYKLGTFNFYFILIPTLFLVFSFIFFRFINKPEIQSFDKFGRNILLGCCGFIVSIVVFISSFSMFFKTNDLNIVSMPFNFLFFLTGTIFSASLFFLCVCLIIGFDYYKLSLILFFCSAFFWAIVRFMNLICTASFQDYDMIEYKFNTLGLIFLFAFFYYFGRLALDYNNSTTGCKFLAFGFLYVFLVFANVIPKLILNFYSWSHHIKFNSSFFKINIDLFNFYNFNLVDFVISFFVFLFIMFFIFKNNKKESI